LGIRGIETLWKRSGGSWSRNWRRRLRLRRRQRTNCRRVVAVILAKRRRKPEMALVGTFGVLLFEASGMRVHTFSDLAVSTENRYAQHDVHLETPILEFTGPGLTEVSFAMNFNKEWGSDPIASLLILRAYLKWGFISPLLVGMRPVTLGFNLFVCTAVSEEHKFFDARGVLFGAAVQVQLKEYRLLL
jgi:Phage P2 GpU